MASLQLSIDQVWSLIDQLELVDKQKLFERLKPEIIPKRWQSLFERVDRRFKSDPMSEVELNAEIEHAREDFYAHRS